MNPKLIGILCILSAPLAVVSCSGYAVALNNLHPSSTHESLLVQPSILAVDIPRGLSGVDAKDLSVEVFRAGRKLKHSQIDEKDIGNEITRWNVDISPLQWSKGSYDIKIFSSEILVHQLETEFKYEFTGPWDY